MVQTDFYDGINKIVNYFARTSKGGFLFCSHDKTLVLRQIAKTVIERADQKKLDIKELYLRAEDADVFWRKIRDIAREKPDGIIISNLDELIVLTEDQIIKDFNLSRDILLGLDVQILFCLSRENVSKFANQASDLFLRRDRGVIFFPDPPGETAIDRFKELFTPTFRESVEFESLKLKMGLLEKQLKEAEEKKYKPERIANEIALDLIEAYLDALLVEDAKRLFHKYKAYYNLKDHLKTVNIVARLFRDSSQLDDALELSFKAKTLNEAIGNEKGLISSQIRIGGIYHAKGELAKGLDYFLQGLETIERSDSKDLLSNVLLNIGSVYYKMGELDKALRYFLKAMQVEKKNGDSTQLATIYLHLGIHYFHKKEYEMAFEYVMNTKRIYEEKGVIADLGIVYVLIGSIYLEKRKLAKALENFLLSQKLLKNISISNSVYRGIQQEVSKTIIRLKDEIRDCVPS